MEQRESRLIIRSDSNPQKSFASLIPLSVGCVILGIVLIVLGSSVEESLNYASSDFEKLTPMILWVVGGMLIVSCLAYPFVVRNTVSKQSLIVYDDHIEGTGFHVVAGTQSLNSFYEKMESIASVSVASEKVVAVNLTNGSVIRCVAYNAQDVAMAIRRCISK